MSYAEHRLEKFTNPVSALADRPQLSPAKMKAAFDACPNELREKHNGLCDSLSQDISGLTERIDGYRAQTFPGEISRTMLEQPLQDEISAKAEQTALQATDTHLSQTDSRLAETQQILARKCNIKFGTFDCPRIETDTSVTVSLGFKPLLVLVIPNISVNANASPLALAWQGSPHNQLTLTENGFVFRNNAFGYNSNNSPYRYLVFYAE